MAAFALLLMLVAQFLIPAPAPAAEPGGLALRLGRPVQPTLVAVAPTVLRQPLFAPDRRAVAGGGVVVAETGEAGPPRPVGLDAYAVVGTASAGRAARAFLRGPGGVRAVRPGQQLAGWRVAAIGRDSVRFSRGGRSRTLSVGAGPTVAAAPDEGDASLDEEEDAE